MTRRDRPGARVMGTRTTDVQGNPNVTMATGKPWRIVTCSHCEREMWTSTTARGFVALAGLNPVYVCEPCAGMPVK